MPKAINLTYRGRTQSIAKWAEECGIDRGIIYARLRKGFCVEDVLTKPKQDQSKRGRLLEYCGRRQTLTQWAAELKLSVSQLWRRVKIAGNLKDAIESPAFKKGRGQGSAILVEYIGRKQSYSDWAREFGIPPRLLFSRLHAGWSLDMALTTKGPEEDAEKYQYGARYYTKRQLCKKLGIAMPSLKKFLEMGVGVDEIAKVVGRG